MGKGRTGMGRRGATARFWCRPGRRWRLSTGVGSTWSSPGQRAVVAHGGRGGHGNKRFATSTRQAPRFAEKGTSGEQGWIELRLKLLADVGLIGLPNAGKSSLLGRLTRASSKVGDYPFTTTSPVLGTIEDDERQAVVADIPGLIEGAAEGAGLGHEFLAHVERCSLLVHLVDLAPLEGDPVANYEAVRAELASYGAGLELLPELVVLSKRDLLPAAEVERALAEWRSRLSPEGVDEVEHDMERKPHSPPVIAVSSATGVGLDDLRGRILTALDEAPGARPEVASSESSDFEAEHRVYRPAGEGGYWVERDDDGAFRIAGRGVELLFERHDLGNEEALAYLEQRLNEIGAVAALRAAGFEPGDDVRVGEHEFELFP